MESPGILCPDCKKYMPNGLDVHYAVWHQGRVYVECGLCGQGTADFAGHYSVFHEGEDAISMAIKAGSRLMVCPICAQEGKRGMSTVSVEFHLKLCHRVADCKCGLAMTSPVFHTCVKSYKTTESLSYCYLCPGWQSAMTRREYYEHLESHMSKITSGFRGCSICNAYFETQDGVGYQTHSCGEMRRNKKGDGDVTCGKCGVAVKNLPELKDHFDRVHYKKEPLTQAELDFEMARGDVSKFPCEKCKKVFSNGHDWDKHDCNEEEMKKKVKALDFLSDTAAVLAKIGRPDASGGKNEIFIRCASCGNRFSGEDGKTRYENHACRVKHHDKRRLALLVSPTREDKTHMDLAVTSHGGGVIVYVRGIPSEEHIAKLFREAGATVVQLSGATPEQRDRIMVQQCDLVLAFPNKQGSKKSGITQAHMTIMGVKVDTVVFPDQTYIPMASSVPATPPVPTTPPEGESKSTENAVSTN